jgi:hypothetical protein
MSTRHKANKNGDGEGERKPLFMQRDYEHLPQPVFRRACVAVAVGLFTIGLVLGCTPLTILSVILLSVMGIITILVRHR